MTDINLCQHLHLHWCANAAICSHYSFNVHHSACILLIFYCIDGRIKEMTADVIDFHQVEVDPYVPPFCYDVIFVFPPILWLAGVTLGWHMLNPSSKRCLFVQVWCQRQLPRRCLVLLSNIPLLLLLLLPLSTSALLPAEQLLPIVAAAFIQLMCSACNLTLLRAITVLYLSTAPKCITSFDKSIVSA